MGLDEVARQLYAAPPGEFVATRDEYARQARDVGDRQLADALRKLRRPTQSAWLVNLLLRERPELVDDLLSVGAEFRGERLTRQRLHELSERRRELLHRLQSEAERLSTEAGLALTAERAREVEATLTAAVADPDAADQVRAGRLATALSYSGLGPELQFAPEPRPPASAPESDRDQAGQGDSTLDADETATAEAVAAERVRLAARQAARRLVAERTAEWRDAARQRDALRKRREELQTELHRIQQRLDRVERDLDAAEQNLAASAQELSTAEAQAARYD